MRPIIIALGRSDNHPLLANHARALGIDYLGIEGFEASDLLRDHGALLRWLDPISKDDPIFLAAIDSSISFATLNSFASALSDTNLSRLSLRTDPSLLSEIEKLNASESASESASTNASEGEEFKLLHLLTIARSPHGQIAIWPVITIGSDGRIVNAVIDSEESDESLISLAIEGAIREATELSLVGVLNYAIDPTNGALINRQFGASTFTFWSESACYTTITEQIVRSILDLPLGDARMIDFEEYYLEEVIDLEPDLIKDPIRPFLHLFARNPRLKVRYSSQDDVADSLQAQISLFASSQEEVLEEMAHAREFMLGRESER